MESKVSEGGLNVTLTIRLLMHGKVMWAEVGPKAGGVEGGTWDLLHASP